MQWFRGMPRKTFHDGSVWIFEHNVEDTLHLTKIGVC